MRVYVALFLLLSMGCSGSMPKLKLRSGVEIEPCSWDKELHVLYPVPCYIKTKNDKLILFPRPNKDTGQGLFGDE